MHPFCLKAERMFMFKRTYTVGCRDPPDQSF
nr:MAG TPA: hypothetical protein [Caudoviricetes sp.]